MTPCVVKFVVNRYWSAPVIKPNPLADAPIVPLNVAFWIVTDPPDSVRI